MARGLGEVREKLKAVEPTASVIPKTSDFLLTFEKEAKDVVSIWKEVFDLEPKRRLALLFVCNDIIQKARKTAPQFAEFWKPILPGCMKQIYETRKSENVKQVRKMLKIWRDRKVFDSIFTRKAMTLIGLDLSQSRKRRRSSKPSTPGLPGARSVRKLNHPIVRKLATLESEEPVDSALASKVAELFPKLLSPAVMNNRTQRSKCLDMLRLYKRRLDGQIESREALIKELELCRTDQETHIRRAQSDLTV
mmetsp:Transcript_4479/g.8003  ORF Transcript_4479/g.8003 Transcript_4479/m.8003 type:complete len:250 (-) Transcript_4479:635-1384(-)